MWPPSRTGPSISQLGPMIPSQKRSTNTVSVPCRVVGRVSTAMGILLARGMRSFAIRNLSPGEKGHTGPHRRTRVTVVIAGYARSPFHPARRGRLAGVRPDDLAGAVIAALVERTGVDPAALEDVVLGCAFPEAEQGMNLGRIAGMIAGLPRSVAGATVNRLCGSSMQAVHI